MIIKGVILECPHCERTILIQPERFADSLIHYNSGMLDYNIECPSCKEIITGNLIDLNTVEKGY